MLDDIQDTSKNGEDLTQCSGHDGFNYGAALFVQEVDLIDDEQFHFLEGGTRQMYAMRLS